MGIIDNQDAQFMLLAGFIIAMGLVITTVMLNSIIFEGNMAIGTGTDPSKNEIISLMQIAKDETGAAYRNATASGGTASQKINNFTNQTRNFRDNLTTIYALHGEGVNVTWDKDNWENGIYANFTENGTANGISNWTVVEGVINVYSFELRNATGTIFEVNANSQTTGAFLWSLKLNGNDNISIKNASSYVNYFDVNFTNMSLLNESWGSYKFNTNTGNNITKITFMNGRNASGRFSITGNTTGGRNFTRARDHILNPTITFYTSRVGANITIPVSVPW